MTQDKFKKTIDNARQILVGKLPNPQDQIDAITYALMYKFMNDIDDKSASLPGGKRTYFAGDYEKYSWHNLMRADGQDQLILYREAIEKMSKNGNLPLLFREIFTGAMLKFNDPRTLRLFLKEMDEFTHGNGDSLGDSYEYLLSLMGSQGGLGQFRTPRHIIKFIVDAVDPDKTDRIIDPAVGTGGFLIEAYNHILRKHDGRDEQGNQTNSEKRLTAGELDKIHSNFRGFDIDATMIRTARVNLYLHDFKTPDIIEHDSLTSEDYWTDRYDVILANPPFMSPKGGIQPHKKFGVQANRAEVLFVDYIASHLKPTGKAGVIVPEGVIFQSGTAYKQLRKNLVENSLLAVVSLPAGVFQPYAGVKTSVLILDSGLAKEREDVLFVKVENDGLSLSAQRRIIAENDLPQALEIINQFKEHGTLPEDTKGVKAQLVSRNTIAENANYDLTGDRYSKTFAIDSHFPQITLGELEKDGKIEFLRGQGISKSDITEDGKFKGIRYGELYTIYQSPVIENVISRTDFDGKVRSKVGDVYVPATTTADAMGIAIARSIHEDGVVIGGDINIIRPDQQYINPDYLSWLINGPLKAQLATYAKGANILHISNNDLRQLEVILPPLEVQLEIVEKIATKQKAISHAREVIKALERERRYFDPRPLAIKQGWPIVKLGELVNVNNGQVLTSFDEQGTACVKVGDMNLEENKTYIITSSHWTNKQLKGLVDVNSVIFPKRGAAIATNKKRLTKIPCYIDNNCMGLTSLDNKKLLGEYLYVFMNSFDLTSISNSAGVALINNPDIKGVDFPLPPIEFQKEIVKEFQEQDSWIAGAKNTVAYMEKAINSTLSELWSD